MVDSVFSWVNPVSSRFCRSTFILAPSTFRGYLKAKFYAQDRHIAVTPGKETTVEVSGTHIITATDPELWKLEGNWLTINIKYFLSTLVGLMQMKNLDPHKRGCRFKWESDSLTFHSRCFLDALASLRPMMEIKWVIKWLRFLRLLQLEPSIVPNC